VRARALGSAAGGGFPQSIWRCVTSEAGVEVAYDGLEVGL
jgi:hypothetical protein